MLDCNSIDKVVIINLCVDKASIFNRKESMESLKDFIESQAQVLSFGNKKDSMLIFWPSALWGTLRLAIYTNVWFYNCVFLRLVPFTKKQIDLINPESFVFAAVFMLAVVFDWFHPVQKPAPYHNYDGHLLKYQLLE